MPRKNTILQSEFPYHITARCINSDWFRLDIESVWSIFGDYLFILKHEFNFEIHSFVLMDNHFHLLLKTPSGNLSSGMNYFLREVSKEISFKTGRINQTFGGPYKWCIVNSYIYYLNTYKYIYRNPVEAYITPTCEEYPFSTLPHLLGFYKLNFPVEEDTLLFNPNLNCGTLEWLNTSRLDMHKHVSYALKKPIFGYKKNPVTKEPLIPLHTMY